jgi:hypothetical protein
LGYQLARAWAQSNPIRRQYYDSGPNEGIGFHAEEMLLPIALQRWERSGATDEIDVLDRFVGALST